MRKYARRVVVLSVLILFTTEYFFEETDIVFRVGLLLSLVLFIPGVLVMSALPKTPPRSMNKRAVATMQQVRETGTAANGLVRIELIFTYTTEQGQQVTAKAREAVDFEIVDNLKPGEIFTIAYNENKPQKVIVVPSE